VDYNQRVQEGMSKDPAILFYTSDFLSGCSGLTMEERGQYITLLCLQHQAGHLSEKTIRLSVGSVSVDVMAKFLLDENGLYYNDRMESEINKRAQFIDSRRVNGQKGGRPIKPSGKPYAKPNGEPTHNLPESVNEDDNKDNKGVAKKRKQKPFVPPTCEEVKSYFVSFGYSSDAGEKAFNWYASADWFDSKGEPVRNWKQKMQRWFTPENKKQSEIIPTYKAPPSR
jgi:hypothetical protein